MTRYSQKAKKSTTPIAPITPTPSASRPLAKPLRRFRGLVRFEERRTHQGETGLGIGKGGSVRMVESINRSNQRVLPRRTSIEREGLLRHAGRSIPNAPFARVVRSIMREKHPGYRIQFAVIGVLLEVAERYLIEVFEASSLLVAHARRVTLMPRDLALYTRLKGIKGERLRS